MKYRAGDGWVTGRGSLGVVGTQSPRGARRGLGTAFEILVFVKILSLSLLAALAGCATAPPVISAQQMQSFDALVRSAEAAGAAKDPPEAAAILMDAKSDFYYAQHIPRDPDHARRLVTKALAEATQALALAQRRTEQGSARELARQEASTAAATAQ